MFNQLIVLVILVTSPALTAVVKNNSLCSANEFSCGDDACVSLDRICDGRSDCADGSDEAACHGTSLKSGLSHSEDLVLSRIKRQSTCKKNQWRCRDGTCIPFDGKCDGMVDCQDRSDESHALCRNNICQYNWFRCTYGACVDGTAPCNGVQECADNSDELLPRCRNETDEVRGQFRCQDGSSTPASNHCDGVADCPDGSDETVRACAAKSCPSYLFQCAYGACVDQGSDCNGKIECADESDEDAVLCNRLGPIVTPNTPSPTATPTPTLPPPTTAPPKRGNCELPEYPKHGHYTVLTSPGSKPGQWLDAAQLNVSCNPGYGVMGSSTAFCYQGSWSQTMPKCVRLCKLNMHESVEYYCEIKQGTSLVMRTCNKYEPVGTTVRPVCRNLYYAPKTLTKMKCIDGSWSSIAICSPECGRVTPVGEQLVIGGREAERGELPWHAGIYTKTKTPYYQICGGTLVSNSVVISAAHCFWKEHLLPAEDYAVAVGKIYRPWNNSRDVDAQKSDVAEIKIPKRFLGSEGNFQEDIAILLLVKPFVYKSYVRPVCLDFDSTFNSLQLKENNIGKVAGWGLTAENGNASQILRVVDLPYVDITRCVTEAPVGFRAYITSDKICAGYRNGTALCKGDSGGGLVFAGSEKNIQRYYLRGIVSTAPNNENLCNAYSITTFTQIVNHEDFILEHI